MKNMREHGARGRFGATLRLKLDIGACAAPWGVRPADATALLALQLRLPPSMALDERVERVEEVIAATRLQRCR